MYKKGISRNRKLNQGRFLEALVSSGGFALEACATAGITRKCYYDWMKDDEVFKERVDFLNESLEKKYCQALDDFIFKEKNVTALIFKLKSLNPRKYDDGVRRQESESQVAVSREPLPIIQLVPQPKLEKPLPIGMK